MPTPAELQTQLENQKQLVELSRQQVTAMQTGANLSRMELAQQTPLSAARIQAMELYNKSQYQQNLANVNQAGQQVQEQLQKLEPYVQQQKTAEQQYKDYILAERATASPLGAALLVNEQQRIYFNQIMNNRASAEAYKSQLQSLKDQGFNPVIKNGQVVGYEDLKTGASFELPKASYGTPAQYPASFGTPAMPNVQQVRTQDFATKIANVVVPTGQYIGSKYNELTGAIGSYLEAEKSQRLIPQRSTIISQPPQASNLVYVPKSGESQRLYTPADEQRVFNLPTDYGKIPLGPSPMIPNVKVGKDVAEFLVPTVALGGLGAIPGAASFIGGAASGLLIAGATKSAASGEYGKAALQLGGAVVAPELLGKYIEPLFVSGKTAPKPIVTVSGGATRTKVAQTIQESLSPDINLALSAEKFTASRAYTTKFGAGKAEREIQLIEFSKATNKLADLSGFRKLGGVELTPKGKVTAKLIGLSVEKGAGNAEAFTKLLRIPTKGKPELFTFGETIKPTGTVRQGAMITSSANIETYLISRQQFPRKSIPPIFTTEETLARLGQPLFPVEKAKGKLYAKTTVDDTLLLKSAKGTRGGSFERFTMVNPPANFAIRTDRRVFDIKRSELGVSKTVVVPNISPNPLRTKAKEILDLIVPTKTTPLDWMGAGKSTGTALVAKTKTIQRTTSATPGFLGSLGSLLGKPKTVSISPTTAVSTSIGLGSFAGQGTYERTAGGQLPPITRSVFITKTAENLTSGIKSRNVSASALDTSLKFRPATKITPRDVLVTRDVTDTALKFIPRTVPILDVVQKQPQKIRQGQIQTPINPQTITTRTPPRIVTPIILPSNVNKKTYLKTRFNPRSTGKGFDVLVKRSGKYKALGVSLTRQSAEALGMKVSTKSLAASFKLVPTKGPARSPFIPITPQERAQFRAPITKGRTVFGTDTFVQRLTTRLGTTQERKQIQVARKAAGPGQWWK